MNVPRVFENHRVAGGSALEIDILAAASLRFVVKRASVATLISPLPRSSPLRCDRPSTRPQRTNHRGEVHACPPDAPVS